MESMQQHPVVEVYANSAEGMSALEFHVFPPKINGSNRKMAFVVI
jgi:hypothetical protein